AGGGGSQRNGARASDFGGRGSRGAPDVRFSFAATFLCRIEHATALGGTTFDSASVGKCRAARGLDFGQPGGATARAILFAAVARSRGRTGMGEHEADDVGQNASRLHAFGGVAAR